MSTLATKNVAAVLATIALALGISFTFATTAKADAVSDLQAQVQALLAQITSLQGGATTGGSMSASCHTFTRNHQVGDKGGEVMWIQQFLNGHGAVVAASGAGSAGMETSSFGGLTKAAVAKFQAANGIAPAAGYWGPLTRAKANALCAGSTGTTGGTTGGTVTPTGPGLSVSAGVQPANSLAPKGAMRVPFTSFTLTNNSSAPVTVTGVTVQRTGIAQDLNFAGVVLVDSNGLQIGVSHTFDSNHQTTVGDTMTLAPGASQTFTVAGNISATNAQSGEVAAISVVGINTSAPVAGSLPITGAQQTINTTLSLGNITIGSSSFDPGTPTTKHIGDTSVKFSGVRLTNSSTNEDAKFYSMRWRLNGSVSSSDLANIVTIVNGTSYPTTLSADGRYYTTVFPGGILIGKGNNVDVYVQGDIVGTNASNRTVEFDIDKTSDVYFVGQVYGFGLSLTGTIGTYSTASGHVTNADVTRQPWFVGSVVTVQGGTVTTIQNATSVASQNVAVNVSNEVLGGFQTNFAGEPVTVQGMSFTVATSSTTGFGLLTLVSIVDENGSVVAGPVDASGAGTTLNFTNSVTFKTGLHTYTLKGKLPSTFTNGGTIVLSTTPSGWTSPQGQLTGNTITISTPSFNMNTMTVRAATLAVAASSNPASQTIVAGGQNILFANIQMDASQSGEDVQLSSLPIVHTGTGDLAFLNNCQLWDGTTALNTGSDVVNTVSTTTTVTFTNGALRITKGTVKTLGLTCTLSSSANATATYKFGVNSSNTPTVTGVTSGNSVSGSSLTVTTSSSGTMTVSSGATVAVTIDTASPSYAINAAGTTGVTMGVIKIRATNENFNLTKLGLRLDQGSYTASSTGSGGAATGAGDLTQVYLYNSAGTLLGTATFTGSNTQATSTLNAPLALVRDTDTTITVKADLAGIGMSAAGGIGNLIKVDPVNFEGTGASSGSTVRGGATAGVAGVRIFKSYPTLAVDTLASSGVTDGRLMHFKVTANSAGSIGINKFTFTVSTTSAVVTNVNLYGFTDAAYSQAISGQGSGGLIGSQLSTIPQNVAFSIAPLANPVQVPASGTYYFELRGTVAGSGTTYSVNTTLNGDSAYPTVIATTHNVATSSALSASNLIWAGNSTSTSAGADVDWSNGFSLPGLPSAGLNQNRTN